jgi:ABC-type antimicrobial peptide transport system permease subunit
MVTAAGAPWTPPDMKDDEIVVSQWLADDLHVKPGDAIAMSYFLPESGAKLEEATNTLRVRSIVPMEMPWADRTLMPDFPGIEKAESTRDWDAGFPLTYRVRDKDEEYWKQHRGTPKAFITLAAGQKMWANRFGNLTAIRFPVPSNTTPDEYRAALEKRILTNLTPEQLGLRFEPVREQALKAAEESQDFGGLFLGFSFFVIVAALLLMALLFSLGLEQRAPEIGTLLALGFTPKQVRKLLLREALVLSLIGGVVGALGGLAYAKGMLHGLTTIWRDAVGATALGFHFTGQTLVLGIFASTFVSVLTIWLSLRKFVKRPARELLVGEVGVAESAARSRGVLIGVSSLICAVGAVGWAFWSGETSNAESFFSAGSLVLVAGVAFGSAWLVRLTGSRAIKQAQPACNGFSSCTLAVRGCARRRKRSLATVAMLASGSFLIASIGVFRLDANRDATTKTSGTGGFALIGETTMPVVQDLNAQSGRDFFALNERDMEGVNFVPFRVRAGDEASCLNLNAAQRPRLLGVNPELLYGRFAFTKNLNELNELGPWSALDQFHLSVPLGKDEIPAIGDANSIQWAMHKKVGDTIDYVDERGQPFKVRIVGAVANSVLQGQLIIDEAEFVKRFPGESGYRMFLIDAPSNAVSQVSAMLSRALQDVGLELTPAPQRLDQFNAVQNTYLGTFQVLGGLGLLLGSVGLGIVVLRNVLERRGELALLLAVGFRKRQVRRLLLLENGTLLAAGLALGVVAAAVAVLPALLSPGAQLPVTSLAVTLVAVLFNGVLWTWAATQLALRGDLLAALRNE